MTPESHPRATVLIVEADDGIRQLIGTVLEHAGFRTAAADDVDSAAPLLETSKFEVILRDLNLAPGQRRRSLQQLAATPPELLRRTVVMTTAPVPAATALRDRAVFAIVGKPFDLQSLVNAVSECARGSLEPERGGGGGTPSSRRPRRSRRNEPEGDSSIRIESLQRFVSSVRSLRHLLSVPVRSEREAALRAEMRRTLGLLSATLLDAARVESGRTRAAVFHAASTVAARLAAVPMSAGESAPAGRDH